ncbi:MAG: carbohydrate kinase, partial [Pseudomonadota bacterium]|nr:carbohydrate kinase [Pseudomonadota bacterium]
PHILHRSLQQADILKINDEELEVTAKLLQLRQGHNPDHAYQLMQRYPLQQLIVTCGKNGAWLLNQDGTECHADQTIQNSSIVDTVGAGDGFSAAFILGLLSKWPAPLSLARANQFATSICTIRGAIPPDLEFYLPFLKEWGVT